METSSRYGCLVCSIRCYIPYLQYSDKKQSSQVCGPQPCGLLIVYCYSVVCHHNATLPIPAISKLAEIPIALKTLAMVANVILYPFSILETCDFFTPISAPSSS